MEDTGVERGSDCAEEGLFLEGAPAAYSGLVECEDGGAGLCALSVWEGLTLNRFHVDII